MAKPTRLLKAKVKAGVLTIEIGVDELVFAFEHHPENWTGQGDESKYTVKHKAKFAKDVVVAMNDELGEDGSTLLTTFIDAACMAALDAGTDAVKGDNE